MIQDLLPMVIQTAPKALLPLFHRNPDMRAPILRQLFDSRADEEVAAFFAQLWQGRGQPADDALLQLERWYLRAEQNTPLPTRAAVHRSVLMSILLDDALPDSAAGFDLGFVAVDVMARKAVSIREHAVAADFLIRHARRWQGAGNHPVSANMLWAAMSTVNLDLLELFLTGILDQTGTPDIETARTIDWALKMLVQLRGFDPDAVPLVERRFAADPAGSGPVLLKCRLEQERGTPVETLLPMFDALPQTAADPHLRPALEHAHWCAQTRDLPDRAAALAARLKALWPDWTDTPPPPTPAQTGLPPDPDPGSDLAALARHAHRLAALDLCGPAVPDAADLQAAFARLAAQIADAGIPADWTLETLVQTADGLLQDDRRQYAWLAHYADAPHATGAPQYGLADFGLVPVLHRGLMETVAALCRRGLASLDTGLACPKAWSVSQLARLHSLACRDLDCPAEGLAFLDRLARYGLVGDVIALEQDGCRLAAGDLAAARAAPPPSRQGTRLHPLQRRADWSRSEGIVWHALRDDPAVSGSFEIAWPDGRLDRHAHDTPAGSIATALVPGLALLAEDLLIGPAGTVLQPDPYHTSLDFPRPGNGVVTGRGRALRIAPLEESGCDDPVLLLEAFEALHWQNYYHWMVPLLGRICLAKDAGLLDDRRLVVPAGLRPWMLETLDLAGLPADRRFEVPRGHLCRFSDARLMSSVEHVSAAALGALRRRVGGLAPDGPDRPAADGPVLFLSRRNRRLRKLTNEAEIEAMAQAMGFVILCPEDLGVAEQARLFASARGVVAPEGAGLTNTVFCAPGTRVLSIVCQCDMMPIYNDLSVLLGHRHRKLAGLPDPQANGLLPRLQPPFHVDPGVARDSLAWVLGTS